MKIEKHVPEGITYTITFDSGASLVLKEDQYREIESYFINRAFAWYQKPLIKTDSFGTAQQDPRDTCKVTY